MPEDHEYEKRPKVSYGPVGEYPSSPRKLKFEGLDEPLNSVKRTQAKIEAVRIRAQIPIEKAKTASLLKKIREKIKELYLIILRRN